MNVQAGVAMPAELVLPQQTRLSYGGTWHAAKSGRCADVVSSATGLVLCSIADAGIEDAEAAVEAAQTGFQEWRRVAPHHDDRRRVTPHWRNCSTHAPRLL